MASEVEVIIKGRNELARAVAAARRDLAGLKQEGLSVGGVLKAIGAGLSIKGAIDAIPLGLITVGVRAAAQFEQQIANVNAVLNGTAADLERLRQSALNLGLDPNLKVSAEEAAETMEMLAKNGLNTEQILGGVARATVLLANASGGDFSLAADLLTDAMAMFNRETGEAQHLVNDMVGVMNASKFGIQDYAYAISNLGSFAGAMGVSFEDANALIAAVAPAFRSGREAGTSLEYMFRGLNPRTKEATGLFRELGLITADNRNVFFKATGELEDVDEILRQLRRTIGGLTTQEQIASLSKMFDITAIPAILRLVNTTEQEWEQLQLTIANTDAQRSAEIRTATLAAALEVLGDTARTASIMIGDLFRENVRQIAVALADLGQAATPFVVGMFEGLADRLNQATPGIVAAIEGITAALETRTISVDLGLVQFEGDWSLPEPQTKLSIGDVIEIETFGALVQAKFGNALTVAWNRASGYFQLNSSVLTATLTEGVVKVNVADWLDFSKVGSQFRLKLKDALTVAGAPNAKLINVADWLDFSKVGSRWQLEVGNLISGTGTRLETKIDVAGWLDFTKVGSQFRLKLKDALTVAGAPNVGLIQAGDFIDFTKIGQHFKLEIGKAFSAEIVPTGQINVSFQNQDFTFDWSGLKSALTDSLTAMQNEVKTAYNQDGFQGVVDLVVANLEQMWTNISIGAAVAGFNFWQSLGTFSVSEETTLFDTTAISGWLTNQVTKARDDIKGHVDSFLAEHETTQQIVTQVKDTATTVQGQLAALPGEIQAAYQTDGFQGVVDVVVGNLEQMWTNISIGAAVAGFNFWQGMGQVDIGQAVSNFFSPITDAVNQADPTVAADKLSEAINSIMGTVGRLSDIRTDVVGAVSSSILDLATSVLTFGANVIAGLDATTLTNAITTFTDSLRDAVEAAVSPEKLGDLGEALGGLSTAITDKLTEMFADPAFAINLGVSLGGVASTLTEAATELVKGFAGQLSIQDFATAQTELNAFVRNLLQKMAVEITGVDISAEDIEAGQFGQKLVIAIAESLITTDWSAVGSAIVTGILPAIGNAIQARIGSKTALGLIPGPLGAYLDAAGQFYGLPTFNEALAARERLAQQGGAGMLFGPPTREQAQGAVELNNAAAQAAPQVRELGQSAENSRSKMDIVLENWAQLGLNVAGLIFQVGPKGGTVAGAPLLSLGMPFGSQTVPVQGEVTELVVPTADVLRPPVPVIGELKELDTTQAQNWSVSLFQNPLENMQPLDFSPLQQAASQISSFSFTWPELPAWTWPSLPEFRWPAFPKFTWPAIPTPSWINDLRVPRPNWLDELWSVAGVIQNAAGGASSSAGGNALGTSFWRGGLTWVGEAGPELVYLPRGSAVYTHQESEAMAAGSVTVIVNAAVNSMLDVEALAYKVADVIDRRRRRF